jgi:hypothetical protein
MMFVFLLEFIINENCHLIDYHDTEESQATPKMREYRIIAPSTIRITILYYSRIYKTLKYAEKTQRIITIDIRSILCIVSYSVTCLYSLLIT